MSELDLEFAQAFGDARTIAHYLRQRPDLIDGSFIGWLADMLDPDSDEELQLTFGHRSAGNPKGNIEALVKWASIREMVGAIERELVANQVPARGRRKQAIGDAARHFGITDSAVRMALAKTR